MIGPWASTSPRIASAPGVLRLVRGLHRDAEHHARVELAGDVALVAVDPFGLAFAAVVPREVADRSAVLLRELSHFLAAG